MSITGCCRGLSAQDCVARPYGCADEPALMQSDAEPVACAIANRSSELGLDADGRVALHGICQEELEAAAPPRPDASAGLAKEIEELQRENKVLRAITRGVQKATGLIEAAEHLTASANQIKKQAESLLEVGTNECKEQAAELAIIEPCLRAEANYLRARAADRSEK